MDRCRARRPADARGISASSTPSRRGTRRPTSCVVVSSLRAQGHSAGLVAECAQPVATAGEGRRQVRRVRLAHAVHGCRPRAGDPALGGRPARRPLRRSGRQPGRRPRLRHRRRRPRPGRPRPRGDGRRRRRGHGGHCQLQPGAVPLGDRGATPAPRTSTSPASTASTWIPPAAPPATRRRNG